MRPRGKQINARTSEIRVIAGQYRGRKVPVLDADGLRPSGSRIRETLFNWLAPYLPGARVLDLYAGSGILGIEAVSRGAQDVDLVELSARSARSIHSTLTTFGIDNARVHTASAEQFLSRGLGPWDIVFIDPPFSAGPSASVVRHLGDEAMIAEDAWVYVESPIESPWPVPDRLVEHRGKVSGGVDYRLYRVSPR